MRKSDTGSGSGPVAKAALDYCRLGWSVIPVHPRSKRPLIRWQIYQYRRPDTAEIGAWLKRWPDANLALVTGAVSGIVVLDVDPRHGGTESLEQWERRYGSLAETVEARTGGGGRHLYFAHPGELVQNRVGISPGIDLRGDGGYVVAPPSLHASGQRYRWVRSPDLYPPAPLPRWLLQAALIEHAPRGHPLEHWRRLLREGVSEGERNNSIASLAGHLLWHGVDPDVAAELLLCWNAVRCRPPLDANEVVRTVESISRLHLRRQEGNER
ncbi:MAG: bifunctional DNA primase/polymerase [Pseudomonadota bacterium]|nr:bifunctional DNA primase/polymerase [Pseudomonadota bacterium]